MIALCDFIKTKCCIWYCTRLIVINYKVTVYYPFMAITSLRSYIYVRIVQAMFSISLCIHIRIGIIKAIRISCLMETTCIPPSEREMAVSVVVNWV